MIFWVIWLGLLVFFMLIKLFFLDVVVFILFCVVFCLKVIGIILILDFYRDLVDNLMLLRWLLDCLFIMRINIFLVFGWGEVLKIFLVFFSVFFRFVLIECCVCCRIFFSCLLFIGCVKVSFIVGVDLNMMKLY